MPARRGCTRLRCTSICAGSRHSSSAWRPEPACYTRERHAPGRPSVRSPRSDPQTSLLKLRELAERLDCRLEGPAGPDSHGDGEVEIHRVAGIEHAEAGDVTFLANLKYQKQLATTRASAVIVHESAQTSGVRAAVLRSAQPYLAFARAVALLDDS